MCLFLAILIFIFFALCFICPALGFMAVLVGYWYVPAGILAAIFIGAAIIGLMQGIEDGKEWKEENK